MDVDYSYYSKRGLFTNRQHVLNHIDMIFGISKSEKARKCIARKIVLLDHKYKALQCLDLSSQSTEEIDSIKTSIAKNSIYAVEWDQILTEFDQQSLSLNYEKVDIFLESILQKSLNIWMNRDGGSDVFYNITSIVAIIMRDEIVIVDRIIVSRIPSEIELYDNPIPINDRRVLSGLYASDDSWKVFSNRICNNAFIRKYLENRQDSKCAICGNPLDSHTVVHHIDYNHRCAFYNSGLEWRIPKTRVQPNCELCYNLNNNWFSECIFRLRAVHRSCNNNVNSVGDRGVKLDTLQEYKKGDCVKHRFFGEGIVINVTKIRKGQKVTILFQNGKKRDFASQSAPIKLIKQEELHERRLTQNDEKQSH